jgi:hypothetical protein
LLPKGAWENGIVDRNLPQFLFKKRGIHRCLLWIIAWFIWLPGAFASENIDSAAIETVAGRITAENGFAWPYGYDINWDGRHVLVGVAVKLIPHAGMTSLDLERIKRQWEAGIEGIWSRRYAVKNADGGRYPIVIDVTFDARRFHHQVIVRPRGGRSDALNWNIMNPPAMAAHEFGHLLGVFDEYWPGATNPEGRVVDAKSIMTSNVSSGKTYERHYQRILAWFIGKNGSNGVELVSIDASPYRVANGPAPRMKKE